MNTTSQNLERRYKGFINQSNDWSFFLGLSDYVNFVLKTPETIKLVNLITRERIEEEEEIKKLGEELLKEVRLAKETLFQAIKKARISYPALEDEIKDFEDSESGKIISNIPLPQALAETLTDIIWTLSDKGYKKLIKDFSIERNGIIYVNKHPFSEKYIKYEELTKKHKEKEETTLWGAWGHLLLVYVSVQKKAEELEKLKKDKSQWYTMLNLKGVFYEYQ